MTISLPGFDIKRWKTYADWRLLIFLLLFINVRIPFKIVALLFVYLTQFNFRFGFKLRNTRIPLFYLLVFPIAIIAAIINQNFINLYYIPVFGWALLCWTMAILAVHQVKLMVDKTDAETIYRTLIIFFVINAIFSAVNLIHIIWIIKSINPYAYMGMHQRYFINTGDDVMGVSFDLSSTNAVMCAFGVFYFIYKRNLAMMIVCMSTLVLTYSNLITVLFLLILAFIFIFRTTRSQKSMIVVALMIYIISMAKISPQNGKYLNEVTASALRENRPEKQITTVNSTSANTNSLLSRDERRSKFAQHYLDSLSVIKARREKLSELEKKIKGLPLTDHGRLYIPEPNTHFAEFYNIGEMTPDRQQLIDCIAIHWAQLPLCHIEPFRPTLPGKITGAAQTFDYLVAHPLQSITGLGAGNFSSKIAFRAAGAGIRGDYPKNYIYINPAFMRNHFDLYLSFFSKNAEFRSVRNNPYSTYDQMLSEYGILGLLALIIFYIGFFARHYRKFSYGLPIIMMVGGIFFLDYWFEQLSVLVLFELMLFLNIKETTTSDLKTKTTVPEELAYA
ncbi:hypothetical protein SAMN05192574_104463 [Mucilaginibacter gossypiicola]|uniref:O-Antigen ligase n=1 Tax=Mucilaginibacter gossypiicola TaxID=551995 RepID=A0A1H8K5D1_9SPHI|nr:hypothetical protein [Mucilaginibacter gossypiicola]SEN88144.1 hypothetical protein SAMN05192574_104463 [Mucilaginibacter gossypiicola]